ncbi:CRISPR/Cas system CSM-associated protein Csm3 (group 7 of RAMP superfamily) [Thermosporothrix hazakensis]|jgi:CRISPR/Cas system CSM-associated protein Csm3 (group 7 of RAMP superfamily)|uniref:CRISPR/Cas system CSM-associated protein Csm3 (Group 7 of RAMP superfamily) n=1 Tax=Thermosporothrix hazakensis TaxID=644383 RepID=A0A326U9C8_THEHA|nr:RAMP superfamily CRISPR-associated protein [Thermosporothrix hazakensis]PZW32796.1 CRISPR/Cas system CSM-associated protein Csm3 (group 7 of RAMP superfamily) [Thermosporothrix hazakensis]GCE50152.1 hypothetical protein KTH_50210 [Thermosporothrix hazakensis]
MLICIEYTLRFTAPFHLGTGISGSLIDRTISRNGKGDLYVPASTLKGALRECCEKLSRLYLPDIPLASPHNAYAALEQFGSPPTPVGRIFGTPLYPGTLHFANAILADTDDMQAISEVDEIKKQVRRGMQRSILTQVRINRITRTAVNEALYTSEFGNRSLTFEGKIKGLLNCTPVEQLAQPGQPTPTYSLLLLLAGLRLLDQLGANKSVGKGQCCCEINRVILEKCSYYREAWEAWLENLDVLQTYPGAGGH